jgi:hypothetical protein
MLLAALLAASGSGQLPPVFSQPALISQFRPTAGAWVEYALPGAVESPIVKFSVLPLPAAEGRYWLEVVTAPRRTEPPIAVRMLLHGPPGDAANLERVAIYIQGRPPKEYPVDTARMPPKAAARPFARVGREDVVTPAGKFSADKWQQDKDTFWRSDAVPLWGLVRAKGRTQNLELRAYGKAGARTLFPAEFDQGKGSASAKP